MQKHRSKRKERGLRWKDSNRTLSESESASVRSLAERLDGELGFELQYLQSEYLSGPPSIPLSFILANVLPRRDT